MTHTHWRRCIDALEQEHNIKLYSQKQYWQEMATVMPTELIEAYMNNNLTFTVYGSRLHFGVDIALYEIFANEMAERILLK